MGYGTRSASRNVNRLIAYLIRGFLCIQGDVAADIPEAQHVSPIAEMNPCDSGDGTVRSRSTRRKVELLTRLEMPQTQTV